MNKKGFTLMEVLATITILGILSGVAVGAVSIYLKQSKDQAYETMFNTAKEAAIGYAINNNLDTDDVVTLRTLVDEGYMQEPIDPQMKGSSCATNTESKVSLTVSNGGGDALTSYVATVTINCPSGYTNTKEFQ